MSLLSWFHQPSLRATRMLWDKAPPSQRRSRPSVDSGKLPSKLSPSRCKEDELRAKTQGGRQASQLPSHVDGASHLGQQQWCEHTPRSHPRGFWCHGVEVQETYSERKIGAPLTSPDAVTVIEETRCPHCSSGSPMQPTLYSQDADTSACSQACITSNHICDRGPQTKHFFNLVILIC